MTQTSPEVRRRRLFALAGSVLALAAGSFTVGAVVGSDSPERDAAKRFTEAWASQDFEAMHAELTPASASRYPLADFRDQYARAQRIATVQEVSAGDPSGPSRIDGSQIVTAPVTLTTEAFGELGGELQVPIVDGGIEWAPRLAFPGLEEGERLDRRSETPSRAPILASNGTPLAEGQGLVRASPLGQAAVEVAGEVGVPDSEQETELGRQGFPPGTPVGVSGLERAFQSRLAGRPGIELVAVARGSGGASEGTVETGGRVLASAEPVAGEPVRTTIDPDLQQATVDALAGQFGGIAVLDARNGSVLALAGIAFSALQPPGSVFKIVTTVAARDGGQVELDETFPFETSNTLVGREISNADDQACGGTFAQAFAQSCNTVFAPLGVEVGGTELVATAERFGWNSPPTLFSEEATLAVDPPTPTIPSPLEAGVEVGVSAIGQGKVQATPLQMASVAQTIAAKGVRSPTPIVKGSELRGDAGPVEVTSRKTAAEVRDLMVEVVQSGTGTAAALSTVQVAGKTGTAELRPKPPEEQPPPEEPPPDADPTTPEEPQELEQEEDAWFAGFAPAENPRFVVAVMIVNAEGGGGAVAAPIASEVLAAALEG